MKRTLILVVLATMTFAVGSAQAISNCRDLVKRCENHPQGNDGQCQARLQHANATGIWIDRDKIQHECTRDSRLRTK
ncbi:hypothetical protein ABID58_002307 [Bradyrhizobium sp. S3.2.6]